MYNSVIFVCFLIASYSIYSGNCLMIGNDLEVCPDFSKANHVIYNGTAEAGSNILGFASLDKRVPEEQYLPKTITCISIIDQVHDGTGGTVTITNGGVGYKYVELHMSSNFWRGLDYKIQIYTE